MEKIIHERNLNDYISSQIASVKFNFVILNLI